MVLAFLLAVPLPAQATPRMLLLTNEPTRPGLLAEFERLGQAHDIVVQTGFAEGLDETPAPQTVQDHDLVVVFAPNHALPRPERVAALREAFADAGKPALVVHRDGIEAERMAPEVAERIAAYLNEGGERNFERLFAYLGQAVFGRHDSQVPEPLRYPDHGIYHPRFEGLIFADLAAYRDWYGDFDRRPVIGVAVHDTHIRHTLTGWIDATVASIEAAGAVPLVFYVPVQGGEGMASIVAPDGEPEIDALLFYRVALNPEGRGRDFLRLGVPVLQGLIYREGDEDAWRDDPVGFPRAGVPFYFAMAEMAGVSDPTVVAAEHADGGQPLPIHPEIDALVGRALNAAALARKPDADKRLGVYIYNYPAGETNLSASNLNLPASLAATFQDLAEAGFDVIPADEARITEAGKRLVGAYYPDADPVSCPANAVANSPRPSAPDGVAPPRHSCGYDSSVRLARHENPLTTSSTYLQDRTLEALLEDDLAALYPLADYRQWLATRGAALRERVVAEWGAPEDARTVIERDGEHYFVIPRLALNNAALLPQPPRAPPGDPDRQVSYHDTDLPFSHDYLASYAWLQQGFEADALIHFGTHGTAEFGVGKTRGLALDDDPQAVLGELPHFYPYIVDNLAEATLAKRRLRAVMISHQTPPFAPAALYHEFVDLHDLVHDWESMDDGAARDHVRDQILTASGELDIHADLGFDDASLEARFEHYLHALHDYIHELARHSEPIGLHTFGRAAEDAHLVTTVMQMLGDDFLEAAGADPEETFSGDFETAVVESAPYRLLAAHLLEKSNECSPGKAEGRTRELTPIEPSAPGALRLPELRPCPHDVQDSIAAYLARAAEYFQALRTQRETAALIEGLNGRFVEPSVGGDPIRNPDSLPTGRNLYGFDPSRVPTRAAFETGADLMEGLIAEHLAEHGEPPRRLAFTLWSMEVMRHHGVIEGQVLTALGARPVWNERGRLEGIEVIPREALGRPRVDVVLQTSGLYRDAFAGTLELLAQAVAAVADVDEPDNPVHAMTLELETQLGASGLDDQTVQRLSRTRAFSSDIGQYGIGLDGAVADVDAWANGQELDEAYLGRVFLDRLQHAYGPDPEYWGETVPGMNLFEHQLATADAAVFARSSNLFGLLTSDDPFQYLGGLSLGARVAGGGTPALYISNLRDPNNTRMERAERFLSRELRTRFHHPRWLGSMVAEGYSGTTTLQDVVENLWGWQATAPEMVRDDQWQRFFEIYVQDAYELGLEEWFRQYNPEALTRIAQRMLDAVRTGHWQPDDDILEALVGHYRDWTAEHGDNGSSAAREEYVAETAAGFGMNHALPGTAAGPVAVVGEVIEPVGQGGSMDWRPLFYLLAIVFFFLLGAAHQTVQARRHTPT